MDPNNPNPIGGPADDRTSAKDADEADLFARVRAIRGSRTSRVCPHCEASKGIQRWDTFSGRQRYRCFACGRTFSDLTGTILAGSKRPLAWMAFIHDFHEVRSLRETARRIGVHRDTAFRWRHAILSLLRAQDLGPLAGPLVQDPGPAISFLELRVPHSRKGQRLGRTPTRPPRSHSIPHGQRHRHPRISVILLDFDLAGAPPGQRGNGAGRTPRTSTRPEVPPRPDTRLPLALVPSRCSRARLSPPELASVLAPFALHGTQLLAERRENRRLKEVARLLVGPTDPQCRGTGERHAAFAVDTIPAEWARGMRAFWGGFLRWLIPFRGVASRYLVHYLHWYRALIRRASFVEEVLSPGSRVRSVAVCR